MNSITVNTTRNHINDYVTMNSKPEGFFSYNCGVQARRPTYWDFKPAYRAVNSPGLHLYRAFSKVAKPWPPVIPTCFEDRHVEPQVEFTKEWRPVIPPGFELQYKSGNSLPPAILPEFGNPYIEPQDKLQSTAITDGVIYDSEDQLALPSRSKLAGNTTEASPSANDDNPYNIDRWWIWGGRKETAKGKGDTFQDGSCAHSRDLPEEKVYSNIIQLHHPQPQRSTSAPVMRLELQARMQTPSLNLAASSPLDCVDEDRPCVESGHFLLHRLRTRLENAKKAIAHRQQVEVIDLSERFGLKGNTNIIPNNTYKDPNDSSITGSPQMDLLSSSACPSLEEGDSINDSNNPIVPCNDEVDLISFSISTDQPYTRTNTPLYQQTDLLSRDSSPLLHFEADQIPQEKCLTLDFRTNDSGTSFIYQPPRKTLLNQALLLGLLFLFLVALARLIFKAEGMELWILVLAVGFGVRDLTRVK